MDDNNKNLLVHVEMLSLQASLCKLDFAKIKANHSVKEIAEFLSITPKQAILFSCLVEMSLHRIVTVEMIANYFDCSVLKAVSLVKEIEDMERKSLIVRRTRRGKGNITYSNVGFTVPYQVIEALRTSDKSHLTPDTKMKFTLLLKRAWYYLKERENENISTKQLLDEIQILLENNKEQDYIRYINQRLVNISSKCISLVMAHHRFNGNVLNDIDFVADDVFDDIDDRLQFRRSLVNGNHELLKAGVIRLTRSDFANDKVIELSDSAVKIIYKKYPELIIHELSKEGVINHKKLVEKKLYFNHTLSHQIDDIVKVLGKSQFKRFQVIAKRSKLNTGITAIFHGFSGTGKTEVVYQIAKKTRRDIFMVDLSQTKSMWFGESEKTVKKIFDDYRELMHASLITPILFINEADGLFSKRMNISSNATASTQTQNTIQNIILQELEIFTGILIATTNMTGNLDRAFERRFLFKIDFPKPDRYVRQRIWQSKLPELTEKMASILGERFELTGGQIDNQVRQLLLKRVLHKDLDIFKALIGSCEKEHGFIEKKRVGFY